MAGNIKNRRWYFDAALILIIIILVVMIFLRINSPVASQPVEQEETALGGYPGSTPQELSSDEPDEDSVETEEPEKNPAKDFQLQALNGEMVSLSDYLGTPVLINFWATWCPPCVQEMPLLQEIADKYLDSLVVLAVNGGDTMEQIRGFAEAYQYNMNFLADPENQLAVEYSVRNFPTSFFIDSEGMIQGTYIGLMDESVVSYYLEKIGVVE